MSIYAVIFVFSYVQYIFFKLDCQEDKRILIIRLTTISKEGVYRIRGTSYQTFFFLHVLFSEFIYISYKMIIDYESQNYNVTSIIFLGHIFSSQS